MSAGGSRRVARLTGGGLRPLPRRLLRLHRHSRVNVLLIGGRDEEREHLARLFHAESVVREGAFRRVDCRAEGQAFTHALRQWSSARPPTGATNPLRATEHGTLFLDHLEALPEAGQHLLLPLARSPLPSEPPSRPLWSGRLIAGSAEGLASASAEGRFLPALYDVVDKIQIRLTPLHEVPA